MLRLRRHLRGEERRHLEAMLSDKVRSVLDTRAEVCAASDNSCLMHIGGALSRQRTGVRTLHLAEILAATEQDARVTSALPPAPRAPDGHETPGPTPTFPESARRYLQDTQLRRNPATPPPRSASSAPRWWARCPTGRSCARPAARSRNACCATSTSTWWSWRPRSSARAGRFTGPAMARRPTRSSRASSAPHGATEVAKVKSITSDEIKMNEALAAEGIEAIETDLAELIIQLDGDRSHFLVPAIHRNRAEIREIFRAHLPGTEELGDDPAELAEAARVHLREVLAKVGISGANFRRGRRARSVSSPRATAGCA